MIVQLQDNKLYDLIAAAQTLTTSWADIGDVINLQDVSQIAAYIDLVIGDSGYVQFRLVGLQDSDSADEYNLPIKVNWFGEVYILAHTYRIAFNSDQKIILDFQVDDMCRFGKLQVIVEEAGVAPGNIASAAILKSTKGS